MGDAHNAPKNGIHVVVVLCDIGFSNVPGRGFGAGLLAEFVESDHVVVEITDSSLLEDRDHEVTHVEGRDHASMEGSLVILVVIEGW